MVCRRGELGRRLDQAGGKIKMAKDGKKRQPGAGKKLKDATIIARSLAGETAGEIAADIGMSRQHVCKILNSDEVKAKAKEIDGRLAGAIDDAVETIMQAVKFDVNAAIKLLKNFGSMRESVDLNHSFPKPTVVKNLDGGEMILGTEEGDE
jgi:predicted transcriptional regulator